MYSYESITPTQGAFLCCLFIFGPAFGFVAAYRHLTSRIGGFWSFLFACFCAYGGWFASGILGMLLYPDYPHLNRHHGPSEVVAMLFVIPGFVTGGLGLLLLNRFANRVPGVPPALIAPQQ